MKNNHEFCSKGGHELKFSDSFANYFVHRLLLLCLASPRINVLIWRDSDISSIMHNFAGDFYKFIVHAFS